VATKTASALALNYTLAVNDNPQWRFRRPNDFVRIDTVLHRAYVEFRGWGIE